MTYNVRGLMLGAVCLMTGSTASAQPVKILSAVYGTPQAMRTCDAGPAVSSICTGHSACSVPIGNTLCGDPDFLAVKTIAITYSCGRRVQQTTTLERSVARIACQ